MTERDTGYLLDMLKAARAILFVERGRTLQDMEEDVALQSTIYWQMCVIGEAAHHLSEEFRDEYPETPWHRVVGIRNRLIHGYRDIDNAIIWDTVQNQVPVLVAFLSGLAPLENPDGM